MSDKSGQKFWRAKLAVTSKAVCVFFGMLAIQKKGNVINGSHCETQTDH